MSGGLVPVAEKRLQHTASKRFNKSLAENEANIPAWLKQLLILKIMV